MGVTGLWRLVEPTGKPVPVETLENKVLAVDISIWLHQMVKGYQDAKGAPLPNAHLMGLFQRLCKLLYFRIKPIFVFDGAFPELKKETIAKRQDSKSRYHSESERLKRELALLLSKQTAISSLLGKQISPKKAGRPEPAYNDDELFKLPALPEKKDESESDSDDADTSSGSIIDVHSVDLESENFKKMPVKEKYDVLIELKETRKMNSWGKLHQLPKKSDNFAEFQMNRLLKRRKVQECLLETEKEMGSTGMSLNELESLLNEEGIDTKIESLATSRIASNENDRYLLISNVKQALLDAKNRDLKLAQENELAKPGTSSEDKLKTDKKDELQEDIERAMQMSLNPGKADVSTPSKTDESWSTIITESDYSDTDSEENDGFEAPDMSTAKAYIMQYSDFTYKTIDHIISKKDKNKVPTKAKATTVDAIIEELNKEKTVVQEEIDLSSDEDVVEINDKNITDTKADKDNSIDLSVAYVPNTQKSVISLNSSESGVEDNAIEVIHEADEFDEELQRAIQMSLECENTIEVTLSKEIETKDKKESSEEKQMDGSKETDSESSDDDDFEEVPIEVTKAKPVVQLTLDIGKELEDDIFADVFDVPNKNTEQGNPVIKQEAMSDDEFSDFDNPNTDHIIENSNEKNEEESIKDITAVPKDLDVEKDIRVADLTTKVNEFVSTQVSRTIHKNKSQDSYVEKTVSIETTPKTYINDVDVESPSRTAKIAKSDNVESQPTIVNNKLKSPEIPKETLNTEQLNTMVDDLQHEADDLMQEKGRLDRIGRNITEQMTKEAQELLQIFGIPYIIAPMEAEAQCAFLETVKLTDGTITDDSDIWLFGGKTVYKNFFNQKKHVLQFLAERIEKSFNLSREQLILLAMLVGSDYTTGVSGVGPVTALEILASFPFNKKIPEGIPKNERYAKIVGGLQEFKKWVKFGKRTDNTTLKKKLRNVDVNEDFPSVRVVQAYLEPNVEKSEDKFTWGKLDITVLRDYARAKFGWSQHKLDEIIKPVLKRLEDRHTQKTLQSFFQRKIEFQSLEDQMSKRVKAAVQRMGPDGSTVEIVPETSKEGRKRKLTKKKPKEGIEDQEKEPKSRAKRKKKEALPSTVVKVTSVNPEEKTAAIDIKITKTDRFQEIIPQREKDKQNLLQNKMKAIETFRKTKMDPKHQTRRKRANLPKEKAELSESDSD